MRNKLVLLLMFGIFVFSSLNFVSAVLANTTMINDSFENGNFNLWTDNGATDWTLSTTRAVSPTHSAEAGSASNDLLSDDMDMSDASTIFISFSYWVTAIDANDDVILYYWDGTAYDNILELGTQTAGQWNSFSATISDAQYFDNGFHVYIEGTSIDSAETLQVDDFLIIKETNANEVPVISNVSLSHSAIKGGDTLTIYANTSSHGVNDSDADTLNLYCDTTNTPTAVNTDCTGGTTSDIDYPYILACTFATAQTDTTNTEFCRVYDGTSYSSVVNGSYTTDSTSPTTSITSVEGDASASYFDTSNNGLTEIIISGESNMVCRWSATDVDYGTMTNVCSISGTTGNCSVTDALTQGFITRYVACADSLGNGQNSSQNLNVQFYLDYTAPTTSDNSNPTIQAPNYTVTITETDNVDSDPISYYCTSTSEGCNPTISIDNGGTITYTSVNRGANYLRYYSTDDAGLSQTIVNKTININQLPILTSASDNSITIKGGATVNVSTVSNEPDGQQITLYVCSSSGASYSGCSGTQYCAATESANVSCTFASESDSALHTWYAYIFDDSDEAAINNNLTGSYTTDYTAPTITLNSPANGSTLTQNSVTLSITADESLSWAVYSLNDGDNVSMSNISAFEWTHSNLSIADGQYNLTFFVNDSYDNSASFVGYIFTIDSTAGDISAPVITISSPVNSTYYTNSSVLFNITTDESLSWAGFTNNSNILINLDNVSTTNWNATIILAEGQHNITLYANDSSSNKNQANKSVVIYIDLNNPQGVSFSCQDANDSAEVNCSYSVSDSLGLSYIKIGFNATGVWQNSSQIALSGESATGSYLIGAGNTTPGVFASQLYIFDLSGRMNDSLADTFSILDDSYPTIWNITYSPNTTASLDPDVQVNVNATIVEDYKISAVSLMWQNLSDGNWISVEMTNNSAIANGSLANTVYNASFLPGNGTYSIKINATDLAGNINLSNNITFVVANETSFWNGTTIPSIKSFTYNQRSGNNTLGVIYLNNTGDEALEFNISIEADSSILSKFDINYTLDNNATYTLNPGENISLNFLVNTTGLTARLDSYNITLISGIGTTIYEKDLYIQSAEAAYLQISVDTYSSSVTTSQSGITYVVSVSNLGTQDASDVVLTWTLPSIFSLASGNLTRSFSNIPIGGSGTNTITVNVNSDTTNTTYYINASASAGNADSVNTSKAITVSDPITITNTVTINTGGGGGGGLSVAGGGGGAIVYSKIIEMNRGQTDRFNIEVFNKNYNSSLEALTMNLTGFLGKYFEIVPKKINFIGPRQSANFTVILKVPEYKDYEEHTLMAVIEGMKVNSASFNESYFEIQNIKLVIQEISRQNVTFSLDEAIRAIEEMKNKGFNVEEVSNILEEAKIKLNASMNKRAWDLAQQIISIRNRAFEVSDLMDRITQALEDPKLTGLITANVVSEVVDENNNTVSVSSLITGNAIFGSKSAEEVLALAKAAFERGDYDTALQRAKSAQVLLLLERKGNFGLFLYLYWHYLLLAMIILTLLGLVASRQYKKVSLTRRISEFDGSEENIRLLILDLQKKYFSGKISSQEYHNIMAKYHDDIAKIRKDRISLRNTRLKTFSREQISQDVKTERVQTEQEIKKLQTQFYVNKKISEKEYEPQSQMLNERLAEIEDEETTSSLMNRADEKKEEKKEKKESRLFKVLSWPARAIRGILERRREKRERFIRDKIKNMGVK